MPPFKLFQIRNIPKITAKIPSHAFNIIWSRGVIVLIQNRPSIDPIRIPKTLSVVPVIAAQTELDRGGRARRSVKLATLFLFCLVKKPMIRKDAALGGRREFDPEAAALGKLRKKSQKTRRARRGNGQQAHTHVGSWPPLRSRVAECVLIFRNP